MHREVLGIRLKVLGIEHASSLRSHQGKYKEAEQMYREVLGIMQKVLSMEYPSTVGSMNNLALVLRDKGKYKEAEQVHREMFGGRTEGAGHSASFYTGEHEQPSEGAGHGAS